MKTIFITSFHVLISRNILATGLLRILSKNYKVVILAPDFKKEYFRNKFSLPNVIVEGVGTELGRRDIFLRQLSLALANTRDLWIKKRVQLFEGGGILPYLIYAAPAFLLRGSRLSAAILRLVDRLLVRSQVFAGLIAKYSPALIFSTDLQNELDARLLREARRAGVKTLGMVRSWDNLTSKGMLRVLPDHLVVHNDVVKSHAIKYNFASWQKISVVGVPHYDKYLSFQAPPREAFFEKFGFDADKKLILFSPIGDRYIKNNTVDKYALEALSGLDANILVRLPPMDSVSLDGFSSKRANVFFQRTGTSAWKGGPKLNEINEEDDNELVSALGHADVVATCQSTASIDAALFGKPSVIIRFEPEERVYWDSIRRYYDYEYYAEYAKTGGIRFADSPTELLEFVSAYLANPSLNKEGIGNVRRTQIQFLDGRSTERLADLIVKHAA